MTQLMATIESVHADSDISKFVVSQRPEDSLPTPAIVYKHPEPGYKDKVRYYCVSTTYSIIT